MKISDNHYLYRLETQNEDGSIVDFQEVETVEPLRSVGDIHDELDLENNKQIKRIEEIVFTGDSSEYWYNDDVHTTDTHFVAYMENIDLYCHIEHHLCETDRNLFEFGDVHVDENKNFFCTSVEPNGMNRIYISIAKSELAYTVYSHEALKEYFKDNPTTVWYVLRYPIEIPRLNAKGYAITHDGSTTIDVQPQTTGKVIPIVKATVEDTVIEMDSVPTMTINNTDEGNQITDLTFEGVTLVNNAKADNIKGTKELSHTRYDFAPFYDGQTTINNTIEGGYVSAKLYGDTMINIAKTYGETDLLIATEDGAIVDLLGDNTDGVILSDGTITEGRIYGNSEIIDEIILSVKNPTIIINNGAELSSSVTLPYELNKLPNGVADYIDVVNGVYVQRVGKIVFDGSENWSCPNNLQKDETVVAVLSGQAYGQIYNDGTNVSTGLCDKLNMGMGATTKTNIYNPGGTWVLSVLKTELSSSTLEGIKQWLSQKQPTVLGQLKTPIYTPLTKEEKASLPLSAYSNGYIQLSSDGLRPSKFEFRAKSSNRMQLDMLETGHYYLNAPTGNVKLGNVDINVTEMPCIINVSDANSKRLISDGIGHNITVPQSDMVDGGYFDSTNGAFTTNSGMCYSPNYYEILPNTMYRLFGAVNMRIHLYDEVQSFIKAIDIPTESWTSFTTPSNTKYLRFSYNIYYKKDYVLISNPITLSKLPSHRIPTTFTQGMKSSVDFGYWEGMMSSIASRFTGRDGATYTEYISFNSLPNITESNSYGLTLRRITGKYGTTVTVEDEIDISTGKYTKRVGKYVIDGTVAPYKSLEHDEQYNIQKVAFVLSKIGIKPKSQWNDGKYGLAITNLLKFDVNYQMNEPHIFIFTDSLTLHFKAGTFGAFTLENVQNYFKENPMTVYYELETPEIIYVDLPQNTIHTSANRTIIETWKGGGGLFPQVKPSLLSYPTTLSPNTQYTVFHNRKNYSGSVKTPMINLGGTEVSATGSRTVVTTPSTLAHNELQFIGGENTVEQVMVLHGDWTKEGKTVDYFEGLQSSVIGDKTLENLVDEPTEIWSNNVTSNGAVDYVSMDNIIAVAYGNRAKLPEIQVDTNVRSQGQTLVNLVSQHEVTLSSVSKIESGFKFEAVTEDFDHKIQFLNIAKPNTYYTYIFTSDTAFEYHTGWDATNSGSWNQPTHQAVVGLNVLRVKTEVNTTYTTLLFRTTGNRVGNKDVYLTNFMILEGDYTNIDIPYFEGMKSVENPVLTSIGKNLFDGKLEYGIISSTNGLPYDSNDFVRTQDFIPINCEKITYTVINEQCGLSFYYYDKDKNFISNKTKTKVSDDLSIPDGVAYLKFRIYPISDESITNNLNTQIQIEEGSTATPYEPHKSSILSTPQGTVLRSVGSYKDIIGWNDGIIRRNCVEFTISGEEGYNFYEFTENTNTIKCALEWEMLGLQDKIPTSAQLICDKIPWMHSNKDIPHVYSNASTPYSYNLWFFFDKTKFSTYTQQGINDYIKSIGGLTIIAPLADTEYEDVTFTNDYSNVDEEYQVGKPLIFNHGTLYTTTDTHPSTFSDFSLKTTNRYTVKDFDKLKYTVLTEQPFNFNGVDYPSSSTGMTIVDITGIADSSIYSDDTMITVVQDDGNYYADGVLTQFKGEKTFTKEFIRTSNGTYDTGMTLLEPLELCSSVEGVRDIYNPITGTLVKRFHTFVIDDEFLDKYSWNYQEDTANNMWEIYIPNTASREILPAGKGGFSGYATPPFHYNSWGNIERICMTDNLYIKTYISNVPNKDVNLFLEYLKQYTPITVSYELETPQIIQATPTSTYISTRPENGNIVAQDIQIQAEYLNYDNEQSIISPRMLGDGDEIRWEQGSQCYVYENDNEYIPLTEYNELFGANLQAQEYTQYAESVDGADIEVGVALKEKAVYEQTYVKYEDNVVYPETENIDETNGVEVDYICGATWQNPNDLSDIRHLGELREDGQYDVTIRRSGDDEIRLMDGTTNINLDREGLNPSEFELTFFNSGGVEVGKYGDTSHTLEDCVLDSKLETGTVYGETMVNVFNYTPEEMAAWKWSSKDSGGVAIWGSSGYMTKVWAQIQAGKTYTMIYVNAPSHYLGFYVVGTFIDGYSQTQGKYSVFTVKDDYVEGTKANFYLKSSQGFTDEELANIQIIVVEGDYTSYPMDIPYFEGMKSTVVNGFTTVGKNLWSGDKDVELKTGCLFSQPINIKAGSYWFLGKPNIVYDNIPHIALKNTKTGYSVGIPINFWRAVEVAEDCDDLSIYCNGWSFSESNGKYQIIKDFMISAENLTEYEPYKGTTYTLPTPIALRKVGDVCDTFDVVSGVETRRCYQTIDNINDYIAKNTSRIIQKIRTNTILFHINDKGTWDNTNNCCWNSIGMPSENIDIWNSDREGIAFANNADIRFSILRSELESEDVDGFVKWVQARDIKIRRTYNIPQTTQHSLIPSTTQTTQEPTFILPQPLRSVPNGICDRLYWDENKGHYCIEKRVNHVVLDGTKTYITRGSTTNTVAYTYKMSNTMQAMFPVTDKAHYTFPLPASQNSVDGEVGLGISGTDIFVELLKSDLTVVNVEGARQYFETNPQTLYYALYTSQIIDLPHLNEKVELPTQPNIYPIGYKAVHEKANPEIGLTIPYKQLNMPTQPVNLNFVMDIADYVLTWDDVKEARQYNIILNDEVIATVKEPQYNTGEEMYGYILVEANNETGDSVSKELYIKTVPNAPAQLTVAHNPQTDYYDFEISFIDKSAIADYYTVQYRVDGGEWIINNIENDKLAIGDKKLWSFSVYEIKESIEVWATASNDVGTNDILPSAIYYMSPTPQWTYRMNSKEVFLRWIDNSPYDVKYKLRYSYLSNGQYQYAYFEGDKEEIGKLYEAVVPLAENDEVAIALCIVSEKENLYCKPVKASKELDPNIVPPLNFNYRWLARGLIEFYWQDQYDVDVEYEYILETMKGSESVWTQVNETITSTDVEGTGTVYRVEYQLEDLEQIRMKVRMKWAMNETQWTETLTTVFIPVEGNPPTYIRRTQTAEGLLVEWEAQAYIDSYHIYVIDNTTKEVLQHLETQDNNIIVDLDYSNSIELAIYEISRFSGGIESDPTDSMVFTPTMSEITMLQNIYQPCVEEHSIEVSTVQKGSKQPYVIHDVSYTPNVESESDLQVNVSTPFIISYHPTEIDVHQVGSKAIADMDLKIKTLDTRTEETVEVMTFERITDTYDMNFQVYTPSVMSYPITLEVSKVRIVCLGDSLTSGHPFYWAETGTGDITASYPYQLSRRLKNQYEVINSGYGSDTTDRCLARFDRDVLRYFPQYCLFQCGTNDLYWAMAESLNNQEALDMKMQVVRENTMEVVKRCWDNGIIPIIGTLIPRTGATGIYKTALYEHNEWIISWCNEQSASGRDIFYVDFFNAGKDVVPPTPLEDPNNPGAMNPIYDGDRVYDEFGNLEKEGRGIHLNPEGYKIMASAVPLSIFQTYDTGLKMYRDAQCTFEDNYDDSDKLNSFYTIEVDNVRRSKTKTIIRYVKNIGRTQVLFAMYGTDMYNMTMEFIGTDGSRGQFANGLLAPDMVAKVTIEINLGDEDFKASFNMHLASREYSQS